MFTRLVTVVLVPDAPVSESAPLLTFITFLLVLNAHVSEQTNDTYMIVQRRRFFCESFMLFMLRVCHNINNKNDPILGHAELARLNRTFQSGWLLLRWFF